jgi:hypothetical protein
VQKHDQTHWQFEKLLPIWSIFLALILQAFIKDSGVFNIPTCGWAYWIIYLLYVSLCAVAVTYSLWQLKKDISYREKIGFPSYRGEVKFDSKRLSIVAGVSVMAGAVAAVVGIGGGMIYIPMLLIIGYPPFVASSTSMLMVMYSAAANFISYTIGGNVNIGYAFWLALWT